MYAEVFKVFLFLFLFLFLPKQLYAFLFYSKRSTANTINNQATSVAVALPALRPSSDVFCSSTNRPLNINFRTFYAFWGYFVIL
jgi:hypothetical protein